MLLFPRWNHVDLIFHLESTFHYHVPLKFAIRYRNKTILLNLLITLITHYISCDKIRQIEITSKQLQSDGNTLRIFSRVLVGTCHLVSILWHLISPHKEYQLKWSSCSLYFVFIALMHTCWHCWGQVWNFWNLTTFESWPKSNVQMYQLSVLQRIYNSC